VNYVKARHAAYMELDNAAGGMFGDANILMMLYANGFGVAPNIDLAIKLACDLGGAPMELQGRVMHLDTMRDKRGPAPFDLCDDVTSGYMSGHCEDLAEERRNAQRARKLDALTKTWPKHQLDALSKLRVASETFWETRANNEIDLSGTARAAFMTEEVAAGRRALLEALQRLERGDLPKQGPADYQTADAALNTAYRRALARDHEFTTVTPEGIRTTEKKWIVLRDAWVAFGAARYPTVAPDAWKAWLSTVRAAQLSDL
jgi:uncharacterized protein YecT (DUF1311 family)